MHGFGTTINCDGGKRGGRREEKKEEDKSDFGSDCDYNGNISEAGTGNNNKKKCHHGTLIHRIVGSFFFRCWIMIMFDQTKQKKNK